jgi:hypothetical protein
VRAIRDARRATVAESSEQVAARIAAAPREAGPFTLLGDESRGLVEQGPPLARASRFDEAATTPGAEARQRSPEGQRTASPLALSPDDLARDRLTPLWEGENGVYINFARIDTQDDIARAIQVSANAAREEIDAAARGVRTNAETLQASGGVDAWQTLMARRQGEPLNAEQSVAARRLWEASAGKLFEVAEIAARSPTPENLFQFQKMREIHGGIQREVIAARTETARALQSWNIPVGSGGAERMRSIENILAGSGGQELAQLMAARVAALKNLPDGVAILDDIIEKGALARSADAFKEVWINALLSNPKTHIVNMLGNTAATMQNVVERAFAARWSQAVGSGDIPLGEAAAMTFAARQGIREGIRLFHRALRTGESQFGATTSKTADLGFQRAVASSSFGLDPENWLGRAVDALGAIVNMPTRFLTAEDDFFKAVGYRMELNAQSFRQAAREVEDGIIPRDQLNARVAELTRNPPENIRLQATDAALYQTFTNKPGAWVEGLNHVDRRLMASDAPGGQISSVFMRMLIPFRNTPANLMSYAFERTPMAPLMARYRDAVTQGGAAADIARARMALGSMTLLAVMDFALDGQITGSGPSRSKSAERGHRQTMERAGWQPYSVRIGDRFFSYRRTDPLGLSIGIAADIADVLNNTTLDQDKAEDLFEVIGAAAASFGNQVLDRAYMSGMSEFVDVLHNQDRAAAFLERRLGALVPASASEARRQIDPYLRYTHDIVSEFRNRTPGLSESLPVGRDFWGRPRSYQTGIGQLYDALSPIASRRLDPEPVDKAAIKEEFNLTMPAWSLSFGTGVNVSLRNRPEAYSRFLEIRGQIKPSDMGGTRETSRLIDRYGDKPLLEVVNEIVEGKHWLSEQYNSAGGGRSGGKDDLISRAVRDYGQAARYVILEEFPDVAGVAAHRRQKREANR